MNRKWFIHCLSVVLFFIERSVIFGNHIVEQRNKQKKKHVRKTENICWPNVQRNVNTTYHGAQLCKRCNNFSPAFFSVCSSSLLGLWLLFFMQEQLIRRAYIEKWSNKVKNRFSKRHESSLGIPTFDIQTASYNLYTDDWCLCRIKLHMHF